MSAAIACALGVACGRAVTRPAAPAAPSEAAPDDDGGILARLATGLIGPEGDSRKVGGTGRTYGGAAYGAAGGKTYGGARYGGATYGGSLYANYRFERAPGSFSRPVLPYAGRYVAAIPAETGSIEGVVTWPAAPGVPPRLAPARGAKPGSCPAGIPNQTLLVGPGGAVAGAVVYLAGIEVGRPMVGRATGQYPVKYMQVGGAVEWRECRLHPHVQVAAPLGSVLSLSSADEGIRIRATRVDGASRPGPPAFSTTLDAPGAVGEVLLDRDGFFELRAERADDPASAWLVVAPHPYFAVTDERGSFSLDEVPPGTYTLVVWHEPVAVGATGRDSSSRMRQVPIIQRRVTVRARHAHRVALKLPPLP